MRMSIERLIFKVTNFWPVRYWLTFPIRAYNAVLTRHLWRPYVKEVAKWFGDKKVTGAEIGVYAGGFSRQLLLRLNINMLYLIDPYHDYDDIGVDFTVANLQEGKIKTRKRLQHFDNVEYIYAASAVVAEYFSNESLDFVYIDGNHNYEAVKQDIKAWWPKVKKGGIIGGHDMNAAFLGVCRAVVEFTNKKKLTIHGNLHDAQNEWWVYKK